ncbi:MAG: DUF342 domain-containing protein [Clostridiales bacterium]|nr:DUF342 domain-containing protein [Clostridiales bacterium]
MIENNDLIKDAVIDEGGKEALEAEVAVDFQIDLIVSDDNLLADIKVVPAKNGGKEADFDSIKAFLKESNIVFGIDEQTLLKIINKKIVNRYITVAKGLSPTRGIDGEIKHLYKIDKEHSPKENDDGTVDYKDLGLIININKDDVICEIQYNTMGESGKDVYGNAIPAIHGIMPAVPMGSNTVLSEDKTKLLAAVDGHLQFNGKNYNVETSLVLKEDIDANTGNINFIGDIVIKGNVMEGFKVEAGKSIKLLGFCESAQLIAGEQIEIKLGAINSSIRCGSILKLDYAENSRINCKEKLIANSLVSCDAYVEGDIICKSKTGAIMGGTYRATGNIVANTIGYKSYRRTNVFVGNTALLNIEYKGIVNKQKILSQKYQELILSISHIENIVKSGQSLNQRLEDYYENAKKMRIQLQLEQAELKQREDELNEQIKDSEQAGINVFKRLYPNVKLSIGRHTYLVNQEYGKCNAFADEDGIKIIF